MKNGDKSENKGVSIPGGRNSSSISPQDLKNALGLISSFVFTETENAKEEKLRDVAEDIKRTARRLFAIARAIEDALPHE